MCFADLSLSLLIPVIISHEDAILPFSGTDAQWPFGSSVSECDMLNKWGWQRP